MTYRPGKLVKCCNGVAIVSGSTAAVLSVPRGSAPSIPLLLFGPVFIYPRLYLSPVRNGMFFYSLFLGIEIYVETAAVRAIFFNSQPAHLAL